MLVEGMWTHTTHTTSDFLHTRHLPVTESSMSFVVEFCAAVDQ